MSGRMFAVVLIAAAAPAGAEVDVIIPTPKMLREVGRPVPLAGFRIVAGAAQRARIAADEINERVVSLGGAKLPVIAPAEKLPAGRLIVIASPRSADAAGKGAGRLRPQGYTIRPEGKGDSLRLVLTGDDPLGTLYAAVTCRRLITARGGRVLLQPAEVRDWPDFRYREHGMAFAEHLRGPWYTILSAERKGDLARARKLAGEFVAIQKHYYDWLLRAKINLAWHGVSFRPGDAPAATTVVVDALREVHQYALARGIDSMAGDTTAIGTYPRDKDKPGFERIVRHRSHNRYFCWSRLADHERRARRAADWLARAGYTGYYLHATDGGGWQNPELWLDRCPLCRKTYGDDRAKADAAVFGIYHRQIKKQIPNLKFVAVIYPYTGRYLDPNYVYDQAAAQMGAGQPARRLAERTAAKLTKFLRDLDRLLPADVFVCIRESERRHFDLARAAWGRRRFQLYYEYAFWKGWRPVFITTPLWTKTFHDPSRDDILHSPMHAWTEVTQLLGVDCSWNVGRPGSRMFDTQRWRHIGTTVAPPPQRKTFAPRACRFLFGEKAGPLMAPMFAENISYTFITQPEEVMRRLPIADPAATMREQADAAGRAAKSLEKLHALQAGGDGPLTGWREGYFFNCYQVAQAAPILARHRAEVLSARAAIRRGDRAAVEKHLSAAREHLDRAAPRWQAVRKSVPAAKLLRDYVRKTSTRGMLHHLDVAALRKEVDDLWARREGLIVAHTIPDWFRRAQQRRRLVAVPAGGAVRIDGRLDEPAWARAPKVQHFVDYRTGRLEGLETSARLLYDGNAVYVGFECFDPAPGAIATAMPGRDEWHLCDSVEILVAPGSKGRDFAHWIVDSRGGLFDARSVRHADGRVEYSARWDGSARAAAARAADRWTVEIALPAADLGLTPKAGRAARTLLCRNIVHTRRQGQAEQNACVFLDGNSFHTVEKFPPLRFAAAAEPAERPRLGLVLRPMRMRHVTTGDGAGTRIEGDLRIETDRYLHDVSVTASFSDGVAPLGRRPLGRADLVQLIWRPREAFFELIRQEVPGVVCTFELAAREGTWRFVRRFGRPRRADVPAERLYAAGCDGKPRGALAQPAFFPSATPATIHLDEGTVELWVRPRWDTPSGGAGPGGSLAHAFFNLGPVRPEHPYLSNHDSLTLACDAHGQIVCQISNSHYQSRYGSASLRGWRKGQWHHLAVQWKLDDGGKTALAIYLDGRLASDRCRGSSRHPNDRPLRMKGLSLPIQVGSMNTGFAPADAEIDELRISRVRRYAGSFRPARPLAADAETTALFHFDASLAAEVPQGLTATAGPAQ